MIPLKIETLLEGRVVEHDRVEYKTGWNPNDIIHSITTEAKQDEISELFDKFNSVPFDDRINRKATIENIRRGYLEDFIRKSNSSLVKEIDNSTLEDLLLAEEVANETDTELDIRNIGVLMFTEHPEKFIPGSCIELIKFNTEEAEASDDFIEKIFTGPIWKQVQEALDYIKTNIIEEKVVKVNGKAESERFFNYPYNALEEALVNAVFHKSYREAEPVEIRIYVDSIQILNYPGLAKWISLDRFKEGKIRGRKYRNRRIGELFKEIDLTEKKGTGISKILRELRQNGSPEPEFDMDDDRNYLNTIIHIHEGFKNEKIRLEQTKISNEALNEALNEHEKTIIKKIFENPEIKQVDIIRETKLSRAHVQRIMKSLQERGIILHADSKKTGRWMIKD